MVLAVVGLVTAWIFNGLAVMNSEDYAAAWFGTAVDWVLSADLTIVAIAVVVFMITEARRQVSTDVLATRVGFNQFR